MFEDAVMSEDAVDPPTSIASQTATAQL